MDKVIYSFLLPTWKSDNLRTNLFYELSKVVGFGVSVQYADHGKTLSIGSLPQKLWSIDIVPSTKRSLLARHGTCARLRRAYKKPKRDKGGWIVEG